MSSRRSLARPGLYAEAHPTCEEFGVPSDAVYLPEVYHGGVMAFLAMGYWEALDQARQEHLIDEVVARVGEQEFVVVTVWEEEDGPGRSRQELSTRDIVREIVESDWDKYGDESLRNVSTVNGLREVYEGCLDLGHAYLASFLPLAEAEKQEKQREMKRLEEVAQGFAHSSGTQFGTFDFIRALLRETRRVREERAQFNSGEARMERWMDTRYAGLGADTYFDDGNFENGRYASRINDLEDVLTWLEHECPLLMAKYQEMKLAGTWVDEEEEEPLEV